MQNELKISLVQTALEWENARNNREHLTQMIQTIDGPTDLIILPEMFASGFTMEPERVAETMTGDSVSWMTAMAAETCAALCGSLVIEEGGQYFNRLVFVRPDGAMDYYDKRHTFTLAGEHKVYAAGHEKRLLHYKGWTICPLICYDLRFPVWARNTEDYDLLIYVANWPKPRITAWDTLLKARAIENMSYCAGVNRIGLDANGHAYPGHSAIYDGLGNRVTQIEPDSEQVFTTSISKTHIAEIRQRLKFLDDRDRFTLIK